MENCSPPLLKISDWIYATCVKKSKRGNWWFLLPEGEGQDEGEGDYQQTVM